MILSRQILHVCMCIHVIMKGESPKLLLLIMMDNDFQSSHSRQNNVCTNLLHYY